MDKQTFTTLKNNFKAVTNLEADKNMELFMQYLTVLNQRERNSYMKQIVNKFAVIEDSLRTLSQKKF